MTDDDCPGCSTCEPCDGTDCDCAEGREEMRMSETITKQLLDDARATNRRSTQLIIEAIGSVGPESIDSAAVRIIDALAAMTARALAAEAQRDALAAALASLFGWEDASYLHALMHVENAVNNLRADVKAAESQRDALVAALREAAPLVRSLGDTFDHGTEKWRPTHADLLARIRAALAASTPSEVRDA